MMKVSPSGYLFNLYGDRVIPEITEIIKIDKELHVKLFYKGAPVPLPTRFYNGWSCKISVKVRSKVFLNNIKSESLTYCKIFLELNE